MRKLRILLLEDDAEFARLMEKYLRKNYQSEITVALDLATGRQLVLETPFDLLVLDYELPDGNCLEMVDQLQRMEVRVPFIVLTAHQEEGLEQLALEMGASGFVSKSGSFTGAVSEIITRELQLNGT